MRSLTPTDVLRLWERGLHCHSIDRSLEVLACAYPECTGDELANLPLGARDSLLLKVRRAHLGDRIKAGDVCPACGQRVEIELSCGALAEVGKPPPQEWIVDHNEYRVSLRSITSIDAALAAECTDADSARAVLLSQSIVAVEVGGEQIHFDSLPAELAAAAAASVAQRDNGAELMLELNCPHCTHTWSNLLDVASFVWTEIAARAQRLLFDVHTLARAYGWREADILTMSEARRTAYLSMVNA
jgi:hypothetical protein